MEIKGIDVSSWNGKIDWSAVANYGMGFAILRITEKGNKTDSTFESNYAGCLQNNIPVGVYKYSYATTLAQIKEEASTVVRVMNGRKLQFPVFLDIEDKCQEDLSSSTMESFIEAFRSIITGAGYKFGIYCGSYWYKTKLPESAKKYDCWLAAYPSNDNGTLQERLRPSAGIGWQYSSEATIPGISTKVDRNVFYKNYSTATATTIQEVNTVMSSKTEKAIQAIINIATGEIGYLEKKSSSNLDDKTANAGSNNYTKYWRDVYPNYQGQAWCACFVSWVFMKAFGLETAKKLLKHWPYVYCPTLGNLFTKNANPTVGDIVIFYRNGTFAHTGIVTKVSGDQFWTIEGNTSGASGIIANGGGVCQKSYYNSNLPGTKFCTPDYSIVTTVNTTASTATTTTGAKSSYNKTAKWTGVVTADSLNVRSGAGTSYSTCSFSPLKKNAEVSVCDSVNASGATWYYIEYGGKYGFVSGSYISKKVTSATTTTTTSTKKTTTASSWVGEVTASSLNVRKGAGTNKAIQTAYPKLSKGNRVEVKKTVTASDGSKWYKIVINNSATNNKNVTGYVSASYIKKV